jgi:hypothetical protein
VRNQTVKPTQTSTVREEITLASKTAEVIDFPAKNDREWLMRDVCSAPYAIINREE